jgi:Arc/MetJ-type ribon-helix-helix transcriptional regulator
MSDEEKTGGLWATLQEKLNEAGFDVRLPDLSDLDPLNCRMICMPFGLAESLREMEAEPRENVVMVRVDNETKSDLDSWIETGAVKSRSEAAALFIREGLKVRSAELQELEDALREVEQAKERLRAKARDVLREDDGSSPGS